MRFKLIACEVFRREFYLAAARSPHVIDSEFQLIGLHDTPDRLRTEIQQLIDAAPAEKYSYILLGYGLCSRGTADLVARETPLILPRAHDCITLLLGSRAFYNQQFIEHPGTYYYSAGWVERTDRNVSQNSMTAAMQEKQQKAKYERYVGKYGEDNAKYLMEMEGQWTVHYDRAAFIDTGVGDIESYRQFTQGIAQSRGWNYEEIKGDTSLIRRFLNGEWDDADFLTVPPGHRIVDVYDEGVVTARPAAPIDGQ